MPRFSDLTFDVKQDKKHVFDHLSVVPSLHLLIKDGLAWLEKFRAFTHKDVDAYPYLNYVYGSDKEKAQKKIKAPCVNLKISCFIDNVAKVACEGIDAIFDFSCYRHSEVQKFVKLEYLYRWFFQMFSMLNRHRSALSFTSGESPLSQTQLADQKHTPYVGPASAPTMKALSERFGRLST